MVTWETRAYKGTILFSFLCSWTMDARECYNRDAYPKSSTTCHPYLTHRVSYFRIAARLARSFAPPSLHGPAVLTSQAFSGLWQYLCQWHQIFLNFDADRSGSINTSELHSALAAFGMQVSPRLVHLMIHKQRLMQGKIQKGRRIPDEVDFPSFIDLCITIRHTTDTFNRLDFNQSGQIQLQWENYMEIVVSGK